MLQCDIFALYCSDQFDPFNRQPLTMDMVKPAAELKQQITQWIEEHIHSAKNTLPADATATTDEGMDAAAEEHSQADVTANATDIDQ